MKTNIYFKSLMVLALAGTMTACDENAWNDHLDGFEEQDDQPISNEQTIEYTLTDADYAAIASNATNKALAGDELKSALAAVGTQKAFSEEIPAAQYVPAYLASSSFPYFTLTKGSSVKLTYNVAGKTPAELTEAAAAQKYTLTDEDYMGVWGSDENYIDAFAPSKPAADYLPGILASLGHDNAYVVVNYKASEQEPVFASVEDQPAEPEQVFGQTFSEDLGDFTIQNVNMPADLTYVWSWGGANYGAKASGYANKTNYDTEAWLISPVIDLTKFTAPTLSFEHATNFFADAATAKDEATVWAREVGEDWVKLNPAYPETMSWTFIASGEIDLAEFAGKEMQFAFCYKSTATKAGTWEVKNVSLMATPGAKKAPAKAAAAKVPTTGYAALYHYNGSAWAPASGYIALASDDYKAMGLSYSNLEAPDDYLPTYLNQLLPYAQEEAVENVYFVYRSNGANNPACWQYVKTNGQWVRNNFVTTETNQFVFTKDGWMYDPNVTITLPAGKGVEISTTYYQACVDWVYNNICVPMGDTSIKSGKFYVTSYGNNEYYSGTSAYQGNVDLRASAARTQYAAGYEGMSDEEVVALMKKRFMEEVMPGALSTLHPDAKPVEGLEVLYTVNFAVYTGSTSQYVAVFKVVGPGQFEPVSCTWDE